MMFHLAHSGVKRRSGRYKWGSGEVPYQHEEWFLNRVGQLKKQGLTELERAKELGFKTTTELRNEITKANETIYQSRYATAVNYFNAGLGYTEIGRKMGGLSESTVRSILKDARKRKADRIDATAEALKDTIEKTDGYVDIGAHTNALMGVNATQFKNAVSKLEEKGYVKIQVPVEQAGTGHTTNQMVLAKPGTEWKEVINNIDKIHMVGKYSDDGGLTYQTIRPPKNIDSSRVLIRYAEEGGKDRDGLVELRRGVPDISLGDSRYAQVRIAVDDKYYMKGMAIYSDNIPKGYDIIYNSNKPKGSPDSKVFKEQDLEAENPFGASVRQRDYIGTDGKKHLSPINIVNEEGDWSKWSRNLSSQFLSKQPVELAKKQLLMKKQSKEEELRSILALDNPTVRKHLLLSFADDCEAASIALKAAKLPRQSTRVIIPFPSLRDNEVYAPGYKNGERVVLVRHPHGGKFELPELIVNNKNKEAVSSISNAPDAVGINSKVAQQLSGADFDGDNVLVLPNDSGDVKVEKPIPSLATFDPSAAYPAYPGMTKLTEKNYNRDMEMGKVSNLITDMTLKHASKDEMERAIKHSMVVIDALKHNLNYKQSYQDNGIADLKKKYQGGKNKGASTLISKAKSTAYVDEKKQWFAKKYNPNDVNPSGIDPLTGKKVYATTGRTYDTVSRIDPKTGKKIWVYADNKKRLAETLEPEEGSVTRTHVARQETTKMAKAENAFELSSGHPMENVYAQYANSMKALANRARKEWLDTKEIPYNPAAKKTYADEVLSINAKLNVALRNHPFEREAQRITSVEAKKLKKSNPDMSNDDMQKAKARLLEMARARLGAKRTPVVLTEREWKAIKAGAITKSKLEEVMNNANMDEIKKLATPKQYKIMTAANVSKAKNWLSRGYTLEEIAEQFNCSVSTVTNALAM